MPQFAPVEIVEVFDILCRGHEIADFDGKPFLLGAIDAAGVGRGTGLEIFARRVVGRMGVEQVEKKEKRAIRIERVKPGEGEIDGGAGMAGDGSLVRVGGFGAFGRFGAEGILVDVEAPIQSARAVEGGATDDGTGLIARLAQAFGQSGDAGREDGGVAADAVDSGEATGEESAEGYVGDGGNREGVFEQEAVGSQVVNRRRIAAQRSVATEMVGAQGIGNDEKEILVHGARSGKNRNASGVER